jgi:hypothetical protein
VACKSFFGKVCSENCGERLGTRNLLVPPVWVGIEELYRRVVPGPSWRESKRLGLPPALVRTNGSAQEARVSPRSPASVRQLQASHLISCGPGASTNLYSTHLAVHLLDLLCPD